MPTINEAVARNQKLIAAGKNIIAAPSEPETQPGPMPPAQITGLPVRGVYTPNQIMSPDFLANTSAMRTGPNLRSATFPPAPQQSTVTTKTIVQQASSTTSPLTIKVNNLLAPLQNLINFLSSSSVTVAVDGSGNLTFTTLATTDGLDHGETPWESDPAFVLFRDDFLSLTAGVPAGTITNGTVGNGWAWDGVSPPTPVMTTGAPPNLGAFGWENNSVQQQTTCLMPNVFQGSNQLSEDPCWPLFDWPSWLMHIVFKVENPRTPGTFSTAKKALYIGLADANAMNFANNTLSRPNIFFGLRFDTSTTAPSINDSFFTLEAVNNPIFSTPARNNTQGTTKVTNVAPVAGVWHRLSFYFYKSTGKLTMTLDGSSSNTLTVTVPQYSQTVSAISASVSGNQALINWTTGVSINPSAPFGSGSVITASGFTGSAAVLNGTNTITRIGGTNLASAHLQFPITTANFSVGAQTATITGNPTVLPVIMYGNDDTATPTTNTMALFVDFVTLCWNPGVDPNNSLVPNSIDPRYF